MPVLRDQRVLTTRWHVLAADNVLIRPISQGSANVPEEVAGVACPSASDTFKTFAGRHVSVLALSILRRTSNAGSSVRS